MTCTVCGATLDTNATSCPACGALVSDAAARSAAGATAGRAGGGVPPGAGPPPAAWQPPPPQPHPSGLTGETRGWGVGAHLAGLGMGLLTAAVLAFLGPLVVWLAKRDDHPFVDHHAKEALNFQLTVLVVLASSVLLTIPVLLVGILTLGLGLIPIALLVMAAVVAWFVLPIVAAARASNGEGYRYPFTIRFVR